MVCISLFSVFLYGFLQFQVIDVCASKSVKTCKHTYLCPNTFRLLNVCFQKSDMSGLAPAGLLQVQISVALVRCNNYVFPYPSFLFSLSISLVSFNIFLLFFYFLTNFKIPPPPKIGTTHFFSLQKFKTGRARLLVIKC